MNEVNRLRSVDDVRGGNVAVPTYDPAAQGNGIVHLGVGAFHRAHQAVYTDEAGGDWRIIGVSLRASDIADALNPQNGFYTLLERAASGTRGRVIGSIFGIIAAARDRHAALAALAGLSDILCPRPVSSLADEPFTECDGELRLCLEPLSRRAFPFLRRVVQHQV